MEFVTGCIAYMRELGLERIEAEPDAEAQWAERTRKFVTEMPLKSDATNWLDGSNVPGKPVAGLVFGGGLVGYMKACDDVVAKGYEGVDLS